MFKLPTRTRHTLKFMTVHSNNSSLVAGHGGFPSPVIKSEKGYWKNYSLPIPSKNSQISFDDIYHFNEIPVSKFIQDISPSNNNSKFCHLDPDIRESSYLNRSI